MARAGVGQTVAAHGGSGRLPHFPIITATSFGELSLGARKGCLTGPATGCGLVQGAGGGKISREQMGGKGGNAQN